MKIEDFNEKTQAQIRAQLALEDANRQPVAELQNPQREQTTLAPLASSASRKAGRRSGPTYVVVITSHRRRIIDTDNYIAGAKGLRDVIAKRLELDDGDTRISWHYAQVKSPVEGTHVLIQVLTTHPTNATKE